eukprot:m.34142 g.34142  ORF g.34142 m.34142 type:complete len:252 (+) comp12276_c0_seq3:481-1236(+)
MLACTASRLRAIACVKTIAILVLPCAAHPCATSCCSVWDTLSYGFVGKKVKARDIRMYCNPSLIERYLAQKAEFELNGMGSEEVWVFHGTSQDAVVNIMQQGFKVGGADVRVKNGTSYGKGIYTATGGDTPMQYSQGAGAGCVLLCKALVGRKCGSHEQEGGDSWVPQRDWLVFRRASQVLPLYEVVFGHSVLQQPSSFGAAAPMAGFPSHWTAGLYRPTIASLQAIALPPSMPTMPTRPQTRGQRRKHKR